MSDKDRVESIAAARIAESQKRAASEQLERTAKQEAAHRSLSELLERLQQFRKDLGGRISIDIRASRDLVSSKYYDEIKVAIGGPLWYRKPFAEIGLSFSGAGFRWSCALPEYGYSDLESVDAVIEKLSRLCADNLVKPHDYEPPEWYGLIGVWLGALAFIGIWLLFCFGGLWGILLGWIPAFIGFAIMRYGWLFVIIAGLTWISSLLR